MGEDETPENVPINQPIPQMIQGQPQLDEQGQPVTKAYDLTVGKYDVTVKAGPSFTTSCSCYGPWREGNHSDAACNHHAAVTRRWGFTA